MQTTMDIEVSHTLQDHERLTSNMISAGKNPVKGAGFAAGFFLGLVTAGW